MSNFMETPIVAAGLQIKNRLVMPPLVIFKAGEDGSVTHAIREHYEACRGFGLTVVEATCVSPEGRLAKHQLGLFGDDHIPGMTGLAKIIHQSGSAAAVQIHHAGRQTNPENTFGLPLLAPSPVNPGGTEPLAMMSADIERVQQDFVAAARRAARAGFDAVEIHAAHGYLISQFLSPAANHRQDQWGGSLENRARFLRETVRRVQEAVGKEMLVYCRLGVADASPDGLALEDGLAVAGMLQADGVPLLHISNGIGLPEGLKPESFPWSGRLWLGVRVRQEVEVPVIGVGGIRTPAEAEAILAGRLVDLVAVGRGVLADPAWAEKALGGRGDSIELCRQCRLCHHYRAAERCPARRAAAGA